MNVIKTNRLILCYLKPEDAEFIFQLLNTPGWLQFIGNKNIQTLDDAKTYILNGIMKSYEEFGFGLKRKKRE